MEVELGSLLTALLNTQPRDDLSFFDPEILEPVLLEIE